MVWERSLLKRLWWAGDGVAWRKELEGVKVWVDPQKAVKINI
jgi:hypothetical protein